MTGQGSGGPPPHDWQPGATSEYISITPPLSPVPEVAFVFEARALPAGDIHVVAADLREAMSEPYEAVVELAAPDPTFDLDALLGARCALEVMRGPRRRRVCGVVRRVDRLAAVARCQRVLVTLVPACWALSQRTDSRIFQELAVPEVVARVWREAGLDPDGLLLELTREYPRREYCVQYQETDLAFISRLLEEEGIAYWFRHNEAEVMVLADSLSYGAVPTLDRKAVPYSPPQAGLAHVEVVQRLDFSRELRPTSVTLRDHDFTRPEATLDLTRAQPRSAAGPRALYEYPARYSLTDYVDPARAYAEHDGARRAEVNHLAQQVSGQVGWGRGNVTGMMPGRVFALEGHERAELDQRYLVTRVSHAARAPEVLNASDHTTAAADGGDRYRNDFECIPAGVPFLPLRRTARPITLATQTATVVGPPGEEIHTDHHGRVKVQFHWDRVGRRDERSSCWVRVMQPWAGAGWGSVFIPRVGMEVVVTFLEGDPDRPLVTGCVYNGMNRPPYELPEERTRSTLKSSSSPGGNGSNELRFEDRAGAEEVYLHAQKDLTEEVGHDQSTVVARNRALAIGGRRNETVAGDHTEEIGGRRTESVVGDHAERIAGSRSVAVAGSSREVVGGSRAVVVAGESRVQVRGNATAETGASGEPRDWDVFAWGDCTVGSDRRVYLRAERGIELRCGDSVIEMTKEGITLRATKLTLVGTSEATLSGKGPKLSLGEEAELVASGVRVVSSGASLALDSSAHLDGAEVKLNCKGVDLTRTDEEGNPPPTQHFSMKLTDEDFNPLAGKDYMLVAKGARYEGTLGGDGSLELDLPADAQAALLTVWLEQRPTGRTMVYRVQLGALPPASEVAGAQARLRNLGYLSGGADGQMDEATRAGLREFQVDHELEATGELDEPTGAKLSDIHGH